MKTKLQFLKIRAKNFRSISNVWEELDLTSSPTTLVCSTDNGAGKSTMLVHAPYYVLFDKSYSKDAKKSSLINSRSNKDCVVEVEFQAKGSNWLVRRGMKPAVFDILKDGVRVEDEAATRDYQAYLQSVLGMDEKLFTNSVVLGADRFVPFASMSPTDRRAYVEPILDIAIFSTMNEIAKSKQKANGLARSGVNHELDMADIMINNHKRVITVLEETITKKSQDVAGQVADIQGTIDRAEASLLTYKTDLEHHNQELVARVASIKEAREELGVMKSKFDLKESDLWKEMSSTSSGLKADQAKIEADIQASREVLAVYPSDLSAQRDKIVKMVTQFETKIDLERKTLSDFISLDDCPTCRQAVEKATKDHRCGEIEPKIQELEAAVAKLKLKSSELAAELEAKEAQTRVLTNLMGELSNVKAAITLAEANAKNEVTDILRADKQDLEAKQVDITAMENEARNFTANKITSAKNLIVVTEESVKTYRSQIDKILEQSKEAGEKEKLVVEKESLASALEKHSELQTKANSLLKESIDTANLLLALKDDAVKAQIVKEYIPYLNQKFNEYLDKMGLFLNLTMDEEYNIEMFSPDRKGQTLGNLSAGQLTRVDLAIFLAWREVARVKSSVDTNLVVFDEILEALSENGVAIFAEFWRSEYPSADMNLFVISQRNAEFEEHFDATVKYALKDDHTIRLE